MKIVFIAHHAKDVLNFQGPLLKEICSLGHSLVALLPKSTPDIQKGFSDLGIDFIPISLDRTGMNPLMDVKSFINIFLLIRKIRPQLVFTTAIKPNIYGCLAAQLNGIPQIYSMLQGLGYAFERTGAKGRVANWIARTLYKIAFRKNQSVFFLNPDNCATFLKLGLVKENQAVLSNGVGVDTEIYSEAPLDTSKVTFLVIARLIKDKGIIEYAQAAETLKKKYPDVEFKILGPMDSNPSAISSNQVKKWEEEGILEYCGVTDDVRPYIASCNVFVLPSYHEGMPRSVLEGMAMGRPIITTFASGCKETVNEGVNGYLVPIKNAEALAESMEKYIKEPDLIEAMGKASRQMAVEKFDVHKVNDKILRTMRLRKN